MSARKLVVAGLVTRANGDVLITQRREDQALPCYWEFPGGKVESGETPEAALIRELREEIGVEVAVGRIWHVLHHAYPDYEVIMMVYPCRIVGDAEPTPIEVRDLAWVPATELGAYNVLPADEPLVARLRDERPAS